MGAAAACGGSDRAPAGGEQVGAAIAAALVAAEAIHAPWRCAAPDGPGLPAGPLKIGERTWELDGHVLRRTNPTTPLIIGAIADSGGAAPATLAALGRLRAQLETSELVLALGGLGSTQPELEATLGALADRAPYPIVALPGDLEAVPALTAAITALRARGQQVIDGRLVHTIELGTTTIALIPGTAAVGRLVAGNEGCAYRAADASATLAALSARPGIRIVATTEAPRIQVGGEPHGEIALAPDPAHPVDVILHGPTTEAASPGRGGARTGASVAVTPGSADATTRLPSPASPSAGRVTITGSRWTWTPLADGG